MIGEIGGMIFREASAREERIVMAFSLLVPVPGGTP
jgi:hypothetical protein